MGGITCNKACLTIIYRVDVSSLAAAPPKAARVVGGPDACDFPQGAVRRGHSMDEHGALTKDPEEKPSKAFSPGMIMQKDALEAMVNKFETLPSREGDYEADKEAAFIFNKASGGKARNLLLQPHAPKTEQQRLQKVIDDADTVNTILMRGNKKHANLPIAIKIVRDLMEQGHVKDPQFDRDSSGLTQEERQSKEKERLENRKLYQPAWAPHVQLSSADLRDAIERGVFQDRSVDPTILQSAEVRREYVRVHQMFRQDDSEWNFGPSPGLKAATSTSISCPMLLLIPEGRIPRSSSARMTDSPGSLRSLAWPRTRAPR
jgi:hypothetical protein